MSEEKTKKRTIFDFFANLSFFKKMKQVKHIGLIITIIFIIVLLLILFGNFDFISITSSQKSDDAGNITYTSSAQYTESMEKKLKSLIGKIYGAGNVEVMITVESGTNVVLAKNEETKTSTNGGDKVVTVSSTPIVLDNSLMVVGEVLPKITGVVVVSSGARDVSVKLNILNAVQTLLDVDTSKIQILVGK